jgi:hypothetical protein
MPQRSAGAGIGLSRAIAAYANSAAGISPPIHQFTLAHVRSLLYPHLAMSNPFTLICPRAGSFTGMAFPDTVALSGRRVR